MTIAEVADILRISQGALRQRVLRGQIEVVHLGSSVRITESALLAALGMVKDREAQPA